MKTALVTGACINTGVAIVEKFAGEGWNVVFTGRNAEKVHASEKIYREKFPDSQAVEGIEIQILRVANRCGHAAQICCNGLKNSYGDNTAPASQLIQKHQGKGNEDDQRHIICYKHRAEKRKHNQCDTQSATAMYAIEQLIGQPMEQTH